MSISESDSLTGADMRISVIVPFWNSEKWLARCLDSLLKQRGDFEFILVDDHSTDNGKEIAYEYCNKDKRFTLMSNRHAKGVSGARNTGLDCAKGEWVTFLDSDDEMNPNAYRMFEQMANTSANIVQANHLRHYEAIDKTVLKYANIGGVYRMSNLPQQWCMVWNKLIRKSFIDEHHIRFVDGLQYGEDEVFCLEMLSYDDRIVHTEDVTVTRHFGNKESLSHIKGRQELFEQARALEEFAMRSHNPEARVTVCKVLSEHWGSKRYLEVFGR